MKHDVSAENQRTDRRGIADIGLMELDPAPDFRQIALMAGEQVVDDGHLNCALARAVAQKRPDQRRADKAGSPRDDVFPHPVSV